MENTAITIANIMNAESGSFVCSIKPENGNKDQAKVVYNALNNPTHNLRDFVNKVITVENVLIEVADIMDDDTGAIDSVPRTVLIAPDGTSYVATSKGIFNSVKKAFIALGDAPWQGGIDFEVKQVSVGRGQMLTLEMV